jgi:hypothetical protein
MPDVRETRLGITGCLRGLVNELGLKGAAVAGEPRVQGAIYFLRHILSSFIRRLYLAPVA